MTQEQQTEQAPNQSGCGCASKREAKKEEKKESSCCMTEKKEDSSKNEVDKQE